MPLPDELLRIQERLWVLQAQQRDRTALHRLVDLFHERLHYYVRRLIRDEQRVQDVLQEVWMRVWRSISKLRSPEAFRIWLYRIAHDQAITCVRLDRREAETLEEYAAHQSEVDTWNELSILEDAELVHRGLEQLSLPHREVLVLRFLEDLPLEAIAEVVGCKEATVRSRLHYAKLALRRSIEELCHD